MKDTEYVYAVGRIRVNELSLLSSSDMRRLISAKSYSEAVSVLNSKGYDINGNDYSSAIAQQRKNSWKLVCEVLPDVCQMNSLIIKNDFHNLKAGIKSAVTGIDASHCLVSPSVFDSAKIYNAAVEHNFAELPELMKSAAEKAYDILVRTRSAQLSDAVLDKAAMKAMLSLSKNTDSDIFSEIAECTVACTDIKILFRCIEAQKTKEFMKYAVCSCKAFDSDKIISKALCGKDDFFDYLERTDYRDAGQALRISTTAFEKQCDDRLIDIIERGKMTSFGIDPVVAYYVSKETELLSVRIILSGKINGISDDTISERVRKLYV